MVFAWVVRLNSCARLLGNSLSSQVSLGTAWLMKGTVFIPLLKVVTVGIAVGLIVGIIVAWMGGRRYRTPRNLSIVVPVQVLDIYFHHVPASKGYHIAWLCSHTNSFILFFFSFSDMTLIAWLVCWFAACIWHSLMTCRRLLPGLAENTGILQHLLHWGC